MVDIKSEDIYITLKYELGKPLPKRTNKKVIWLMKGDIDRKRMFELAALRPKSYSILFYFILKSYYFIDDKNENKKAKKKKQHLDL